MEEPRVFEWPLWARLVGTAYAGVSFVLALTTGAWVSAMYSVILGAIFWRRKYPSSRIGACQTPTHWKRERWRWVRSS